MTTQIELNNDEQNEALAHAQQTTLAALVEIDEQTLMQLTELTLPEIQAIQHEIARVLPAGNLPAFILSGLVKFKGRKLASDQVNQDIGALMRGLSLLPKGLYGMFIAGPAIVLYAYQQLLRLAGKDITAAFPQGTWQFYLEFGVREDTARHSNETLGFHQALPPDASEPHAAAAWVTAALALLYTYEDILATDWREKVLLHTLHKVAMEANLHTQPPLNTLVQDWNRARPYTAPPDTPYLTHRRTVFNQFIISRFQALPPQLQPLVHQRYAEQEATQLTHYLAQMSFLATLTPELHIERKCPIPLWRAAIGFIWHGHTYLLPACQRDEQGSPLCYTATVGRGVVLDPSTGGSPTPLYALNETTLCDAYQNPLIVNNNGDVYYQGKGNGPKQKMGTLRPPTPETVLAWVNAVLTHTPTTPPSTLDIFLAESPRAEQVRLRAALPVATQRELDRLRQAPILINWDMRSAAPPLATLRRDHRGINDHALTIFRTDRSVVFDQSHIFFDGMWGMAIAEITTHNAIMAYRQLAPLSISTSAPPIHSLQLHNPTSLPSKLARHNEATAESTRADLEQIFRLRKWLKQRGVHLTINDLLLLARFLHATAYGPSYRVEQSLGTFRTRATPAAVKSVESAWKQWLQGSRETNPALLIPMDASNVAPSERLFPTTFRNPLTEIGTLFTTTKDRYAAYRATQTATDWQAFDRSRRELLAYLKAFGELLDTLKSITMRGESFNTATIRLLGHLPPSMQHLLDTIPQRFSVLNEIIKGNEVFSNVGCVARGSTLHRFTSAKDDGETKTLVWGVLTDNTGTMHISLRDFRPFISPLLELKEDTLAHTLAQDYVDSYVETLNQLVKDLSKIVALKSPLTLKDG
ncbi:MAG: hypothetical protein JXA33_18715 [Anaerolineae bacterium]|nr:hypothetical protein [Anaerolineae bacterium]